MRKKLLFLPLISVVLCFSPLCQAQLWSGLINSGRAIDWSKVGIPGGIPNRTTICTTLNPGATASQINSAISSCSAGQVVFLSAGTYNLSSGIVFSGNSNVTLRGAGANKTFLVFTGGTGCHGQQADVCIDGTDTNWGGGPSNTANWTAGYSKGTTQITLSSTSHLQVGNFLILDQTNDPTDTGSIYVCSYGPQGGVGQAPYCAGELPSGGGRSDRDQEQIVTVTAISGSNVTISPGLYMPNWSASKSPQAWWPTSPILSSGIEDMSLDHTNSSIDSAGAGVVIFNGLGCWVKGIRSLNSPRSHVRFYISPRSVVRDSYFYGTRNAASQSYGVEDYPSSDSLIENNIFEHVTAPQMMNGAASGDVIGYNFSINDYYGVSANFLQQSAWMHSGGIDNILLEGNDGAGLASDLIHGTHQFLTAFRNRWTGWETGKASSTNPIAMRSYSRYYNLIGNVLGQPGYHTAYEASQSTNDHAIFWFGQGSGGVPNDPLVATTVMRWGNYDTATSVAHFDVTEIPSTLGTLLNAVPGSQSLPTSLYLSSKPSWWGSTPWPAIGPDVSGGDGPGGHSYSIPAKACYLSTMGGPSDGSGSALTFNASSCYGSGASSTPSAPPAAPTNLTATPN